MKKIELLAPGGSIERVKMALLYGADAVYFGGREFSLRANAKNLDLDEIKEACDYAHKLKKKIYVTTNIVFHNEDTMGLVDYLKELEKCKVDAIIVSDPLVINIVKENKINIPIHLSTQYSCLNYEAVNFFKEMGVERVVLGRETSKEEIKEIIDKTGLEIETFVHGAMCASYSGRCVLSNYFTNRDANRGGCAQICRFNFDLIRDGEKIDNKIDFTMCSKDLSMLSVLPSMIEIGISSLKIEGRMRSVYYVASVVNTYRRAIDDYYNGCLTEDKMIEYKKVLDRVANRDSIVQFYNKEPGVEEQYFLGREETTNQDYLGIVEDYQDGIVSIVERNYFKPGDEVEIMSPVRETYSFTVPEIYDNDMNRLECARHPGEIIKFKLDINVDKYDMMRIRLK